MFITERARQNLDTKNFAVVDQSTPGWKLKPENIPQDQYILRMMVKSPTSNGLQIPEELEWLKDAIKFAADRQKDLNVDHQFVYITVRSGIVRSTSDHEWHVDGFSMRVRHVPEQNYIWTDKIPTEVVRQNFDIPEDFDPMKHNIHWFFQDRINTEKVESLEEETLYLLDQYIVHRRPAIPAGTQRTFFRISFVPIEIEDDTCTPNPLLPVTIYGREDIRKKLIRY